MKLPAALKRAPVKDSGRLFVFAQFLLWKLGEVSEGGVQRDSLFFVAPNRSLTTATTGGLFRRLKQVAKPI